MLKRLKNMEIFHRGEKNLEKVTEVVEEIKNDLKNKTKKVYLTFDIDGILTPAGIGTVVSNQTLEDYFLKNKKLIEEFKKALNSLRDKGFKIAINTGRGVVFVREIIREIFPSDSSEIVVCETGTIILEEKMVEGKLIEKRIFPKCVNLESVSLIEKHKRNIISHCLQEMGARLEAGKESVITLNPPDNKEIEELYDEVVSFIKKTPLKDKVNIIRCVTAVDITPMGANKLKSLKEVISDNHSFYFGDSKSDEGAMELSIGNIVPENGSVSTKEQARKAEIGLICERKLLSGTIDALKEIDKIFS